MCWNAFHLGQITSIVLGQVDYGGRHGNDAPKLTMPRNVQN